MHVDFFFFSRFFCRIGKLLINLHYQLGPPGVNLTLVWKQQMVIHEKCMMSFTYQYVSRQIISFLMTTLPFNIITIISINIHGYTPLGELGKKKLWVYLEFICG